MAARRRSRADRADRGRCPTDYAGLRADSIRSVARPCSTRAAPGDMRARALPAASDGPPPSSACCGRGAADRDQPAHRRPQLADLMLDSGAAAALLEDEAARALGDKRAIDLGEWRRRVDAPPATLPQPAGSRRRSGVPAVLLRHHRPSQGASSMPTARSVTPTCSPRPSRARPGHRFYSSAQAVLLQSARQRLLRRPAPGRHRRARPNGPTARVAAMVERHEPHLLQRPTLYRRLIDAGVRFRGDARGLRCEACPPRLRATGRR